MISDQNKTILYKRFMSLLWRVGVLIAVVLVEFMTANMGLLDLSPQVVIFLGLVFAEVTKWLNKGAK